MTPDPDEGNLGLLTAVGLVVMLTTFAALIALAFIVLAAMVA